MRPAVDVIVAGQICLDIIPAFTRSGDQANIADLFKPGKLIDIGAAVIATGGAVSNTGQALHRLGAATRLITKVGDDLFGQAIIGLIRQVDPALTDEIIVAEGEKSAYTIVINPPGIDRIFLHCTGTNDTFVAKDIRYDQLPDAKIFHFGYPPLMRAMYQHDGAELVSIFSQMKQKGMTTSLDLARPDPESEAGRVDWSRLLTRLLSDVDVFLPSFEEILYMLDRARYEDFVQRAGTDSILELATVDDLRALSDQMLRMGVAIAGIKLGEHGLYVRTVADVERLQAAGYCGRIMGNGNGWVNRELFIPCFEVEVVGTTGAGDSTIAGFLAGLLQGLGIEEVAVSAAATGACAVEQADATSGVPSWGEVRARIETGWQQRDIAILLEGWCYDPKYRLYTAPTHK